MASFANTEDNLSSSLANIEVSLSAAGDKFLFIQKLRDFVSVICESLQVEPRPGVLRLMDEAKASPAKLQGIGLTEYFSKERRGQIPAVRRFFAEIKYDKFSEPAVTVCKILEVSPVADVVRVRTGERGEMGERMTGGRADMSSA